MARSGTVWRDGADGKAGFGPAVWQGRPWNGWARRVEVGSVLAGGVKKMKGYRLTRKRPLDPAVLVRCDWRTTNRRCESRATQQCLVEWDTTARTPTRATWALCDKDVRKLE